MAEVKDQGHMAKVKDQGHSEVKENFTRDAISLLNSRISMTFATTNQSIQNAAARFLMGGSRRDHISPVLRSLHWLPVKQQVDYKLATLVYDSL